MSKNLFCTIVFLCVFVITFATSSAHSDESISSDEVPFINNSDKIFSFHIRIGAKDVNCGDRAISNFVLKPGEQSSAKAGPDDDDFVCWCANETKDPDCTVDQMAHAKHGQKVVCTNAGCLAQ